MSWTTPAPAPAGDALTSDFWDEQVKDNLDVIGGARTSWTPTYGGGISAIGDATVNARYLLAGKLCIGHVTITMGASTTFAASTLSIVLPVAPVTHGQALGAVYLVDSSATARYVGTALQSGVNAVFLSAASSTLVSNTVPFTWASGDVLSFEFQYETA